MRVQVHIWDTAGQERFKSLTTHHYKGAAGALLVFDVTNKNSFQQTSQWLKELSDNTAQNCKIVLISNKCDLEDQRVVNREEVKKFAKSNGLIYYETSSYWDRDDVQIPNEKGGIASLILNIVEDIVREQLEEDNMYCYNSIPANASQKRLPYQEGSNPRSEAHDSVQDDKQQKLKIIERKLPGGREKTEIRLSGIRLDKESMFEIENKSEKACNC